MAYTNDFIQRVLKVQKDRNLSHRKTANLFQIGTTTLANWKKGLFPEGKRNRKPTKIHDDKLYQDIKDYPDAFQHERADRLKVSARGISSALKRLGITRKKTLSHPKRDEKERSNFCRKIKDYIDAGRSIAYLDESGFVVDPLREYGYSEQGKRCYGTHSWNKKGRINALGALMGNVLLTVSLIMGSINADVFYNWMKQDLLPKLPESSVLVMDNASFHKRKDIQEIIKAEGHTLEYMPVYSPDLNPIEKKWAQAKSIRRQKMCDPETLFKEHIM